MSVTDKAMQACGVKADVTNGVIRSHDQGCKSQLAVTNLDYIPTAFFCLPINTSASSCKSVLHLHLMPIVVPLQQWSMQQICKQG